MIFFPNMRMKSCEFPKNMYTRFRFGKPNQNFGFRSLGIYPFRSSTVPLAMLPTKCVQHCKDQMIRANNSAFVLMIILLQVFIILI